MRLRPVGLTLVTTLLAGLGLAACGSDGSGPSGPIPDLTGTWTMENLNIVGNNVPGATGTFVFTADSIDIALDVPGQGSFGGAGTYTLTAKKITVNTNAPLIGPATGTYTLGASDAVADTLYANLIAQGQQVSVAVSRP